MAPLSHPFVTLYHTLTNPTAHKPVRLFLQGEVWEAATSTTSHSHIHPVLNLGLNPPSHGLISLGAHMVGRRKNCPGGPMDSTQTLGGRLVIAATSALEQGGIIVPVCVRVCGHA